MTDLKLAAQKALEAMEHALAWAGDEPPLPAFAVDCQNAIALLTAALQHQEEREPERGNTTCNPHPDAPHGFNRNASLNEDRYVCNCEGWIPPLQKEEGDGKDAARYRWLRDNLATELLIHCPPQRPYVDALEVIDEAVDAAIATRQGEKP